MKYFIKIENGQPVGHPIQEDNFAQAFPDIFLNRLPNTFAEVEMTAPPNTGWEYELAEPTYAWNGNVVKRIWPLVRRSEEELAWIRQERTKRTLTHIADEVQRATEQKALATDSAIIQAWDTYLAELQAFVIVDALNIDLPIPPLFDANGNLVKLDVAGAPPNVIA